MKRNLKTPVVINFTVINFVTDFFKIEDILGNLNKLKYEVYNRIFLVFTYILRTKHINN